MQNIVGKFTYNRTEKIGKLYKNFLRNDNKILAHNPNVNQLKKLVYIKFRKNFRKFCYFLVNL